MSHFSDIGFKVSSAADVEALAKEIHDKGQQYESKNSLSASWASGNGVELWLSIEIETKSASVIPYFSGNGRMQVVVEKLWPQKGSKSLGGFYAWANPELAKPDEDQLGEYPFVVDVPDFDLVQNSLEIPSTVTMQIAAFAESVTYYPSIQAFDEYQEKQFESGKHKIKLTVGSFISSGLFQHFVEQQPASAYFVGEVLETEERINSHTGQPIHCAHIRFNGGTMDVVADPAMSSCKPVVGGVIEGGFWLVGRIIES